MNERVIQFRVGVTVVAAVFIAILLALLFDGFPELRSQKYIMYISFSQAPGVSEGTPIRKSGILIGRVKAVDFAEDIGIKPREGLNVVVTAEIQANRQIRHNELPQIGKSLLGDAVIEFVLEENSSLPNTPVQPGERVPGRVVSDPLQAIGNIEGNLSLAIGSIAHTSDQISALAQRVNNLLANNDEQIARMVNKTETAIDNFNSAASNANDLLGDEKMKANIRKIADDLPKATADLNESMSVLRQTLEAANRNLANIEGFTKPLGERGPAIMNHIDEAAQTLNRVLADTRAFSQALSSPNGSLGKLINDQELYNNLNTTVSNINTITVELQPMVRELKPIIKDVRVFSDKAARHPEMFGIRGALRPGSGIK